MDFIERIKSVKSVQSSLAALPHKKRVEALEHMASSLVDRRDKIIEANNEDIRNARIENVAAPLLKRLRFDSHKIDEAVEGIREVAALEDPIGKTLSARELDNGLNLYQISSPIGVIGMVFESRPDALIQIASLALKSGNGVVLKGGREALQTNAILGKIIHDAAVEMGVPESWMTLIESREEVRQMIRLDSLIDLLIPRGSNQFVQSIMEESTIPVLGHADGICHIFIHRSASIEKALAIVVDAKTQYPAVCNAVETLLIDSPIADKFLPVLAEKFSEKGVEIRGCSETCKRIDCNKATNEDWQTEYLDLIISVKVVDNINKAIEHIDFFGSGHTDAIVTEEMEAALTFMNRVDSAGVYWNCSTRFADGNRYGFGAEVGVSTAKVHARGPVGLEGLTTYKWHLHGNGHIVADYSLDGGRRFTHKPMNTSSVKQIG